jgi:hypothetical protein
MLEGKFMENQIINKNCKISSCGWDSFLLEINSSKGLALLHRAHALIHIGEYVQAICALASSTPIAPFDEPWESFSFSTHLLRLISPSFVDVFHLETKVILDWETFGFCFGLFITSFFRWPFGYGVWTSMRVFCPRWLCECFRFLFQAMWAHCSRSCSTFNIMFVFYILTFNIGEIIWRHTSYRKQWGDLSLNCLDFGYSI